MKTITTIKSTLWLLALVAVIAAVMWLRGCAGESHVEVGADRAISVSPTQIQSIKDIGEWEFLAVSAEELVDTVRKGLLSDDELVRIYYGTLRLGINMHQVEPGWLQASGDTVRLALPRVGLLDRDFIDEARSKAFFESGSWKPQDREAMYRKAHRLMLQHCLTRENLATAEENARQQVGNLMRAMGYRVVEISFPK